MNDQRMPKNGDFNTSKVLSLLMLLAFCLSGEQARSIPLEVEAPDIFQVWLGGAKTQFETDQINTNGSSKSTIRLFSYRNPEAGETGWHAPFSVNSMVLIANLPDREVKFSRDVLKGIFSGKIRSWNDPSLLELNPEMQMGEIKIIPVYYANSSGWSSVFKKYLGFEKDEAFIGLGVSNEEMAINLFKQNPGSLAWVSSATAQRFRIKPQPLVLEDGQVADLTQRLVLEVADKMEAHWMKSPDKWSFEVLPKSDYPHIFLSQLQLNGANEGMTRNFLAWIYGEGQKGLLASGLGPLPPQLLKKTSSFIASQKGK